MFSTINYFFFFLNEHRYLKIPILGLIQLLITVFGGKGGGGGTL